MLCPNFETCEGELRFDVHQESQGEGVYFTFMGYSAECVEQTCACELTDAQWAELEQTAADDASYPYDE